MTTVSGMIAMEQERALLYSHRGAYSTSNTLERNQRDFNSFDAFRRASPSPFPCVFHDGRHTPSSTLSLTIPFLVRQDVSS